MDVCPVCVFTLGVFGIWDLNPKLLAKLARLDALVDKLSTFYNYGLLGSLSAVCEMLCIVYRDCD